MRKRSQRSPERVVVLALGILLVPISTAQAYIDPGSGSFLLQAVLAGLLAAGMAIRTYWRRIVGFFRRDSPKTKPSDDDSPGS